MPHNVTGIDSSLPIGLADPSPRCLGVEVTGALVTIIEGSDHPEDRVCLQGPGAGELRVHEKVAAGVAPSNTAFGQFTAQPRVTLPGPKAQHLHNILHFPKRTLD